MSGCTETVDEYCRGMVTVIIPVYNVEDYLERCVESVLHQSYTNLQVLLINDGSTDTSGVICDDYRTRDPRVTVIHQANHGLANVRNVGIQAAVGEWLTFIDSDDWVAQDYIEYLLSLLQEGDDLAVCGFQKIWQEAEFQQDDRQEIWRGDKTEALKTMFYQKQFDNNAWGKLYRTRLAKTVRYPDGYWYEDFATMYRFLLQCRNVVVGSRRVYAYFQRPASIMRCGFSEKRSELLDFCDILYTEICQQCPQAARAAASRCISAYFQVLLAMPAGKSEYPEQKVRIWRFIKNNRRKVLWDSETRLKNKMAMVLSYLGERIVRGVWNLLPAQ